MNAAGAGKASGVCQMRAADMDGRLHFGAKRSALLDGGWSGSRCAGRRAVSRQ